MGPSLVEFDVGILVSICITFPNFSLGTLLLFAVGSGTLLLYVLLYVFGLDDAAMFVLLYGLPKLVLCGGVRTFACDDTVALVADGG